MRQTEPVDWDTHHRWNHDEDTWRNIDYLHFPRSRVSAKTWAEEAARKTPAGDNFHMEIESIEGGDLAGSIGVNNTDSRSGTFRYGVSIDSDFQQRGYATDAIKLVLRYFFDELRYQKCTVDILASNEASITLHERLGFVKEGQIRRAHYSEGVYHDSCYYSLTDNEWRDKYCQA
ncbi:MAG: GNAT family protein [Pseudomonadales bacterium]